MEGAEEGVLLITFGSTISLSSLNPKYINIFFNTMRKFGKVRFIWRWEGSMPDDQPKNVMASKWLPQREILGE
jgi:glucuronosyltransferase